MNELQFFEPQLLRFTPPENNNHNHQPNEALLETVEGTGVPTLSEIKTQNSTTKRITTTYNRFYSSQHSTPRIIHSDEEDNSSESFLSLYDTNETKNNSLIPGSRPPLEKTMAMSEGKRPNAKKETISYNLNHTADPQQHLSYEPVQHEEELELLSPPQDSNSVTPIYSKTNITRCHSPCTDEDEKKTENTPPPTKIKKQNKNGEYDSDEDMMEPILLKNNTTVFSYSDHDSSRNRTTVTSSNNSFGKSTHHHVVDNNNNNNNKAPPISATVPYDLSDSMFDTEKKEDENNNVSSANYEQSSEDFTVAARQQPTKTYRGSMVNSSANYNKNNSNTNKKTTPVKLKTHQKLKKETKKKDSHNNSVNTRCGGRDTPPPSENINQNNNNNHKETEHKCQIEHLSDHDLQQQWDLAFSELNSLKLRLNEMTETRKKMEEEQENKEKELKLLKQHFLPHVNFSELDLLLLYLKTVTTEVYDLPRNCIFLNHRDWLSILYVAATFGHTVKLNNNNNNRNNSNNNNVGSPTRDNEKEIVNFSHNDETIKFIDIDYRLLLSELPKIGIMAGLLYFEDFGRNIEKIHICCDNLMSYKSLPINFSQTNTKTNTANNNNNNTEIITQSSNFFTADTGLYNNHHFTSASPLFVVPATAFMMIFAELIIAIQLNAKTSIKFFELFLKDFPLDNNLNNKKDQKIVYFTKDNDWTNDGASRLGYAFFDVLYHHCDDIQNVLDENNENDENNNNEIIPVSHYHNPYNKCHNHPFFYRFKKIPNDNNKNNKTANVFGLRSFNEESEVLAAEELLLHQNKNTLWANISDYVNYNNARVDTLFEKEKEKEREKKFKTKILKTLGETIVKDNPA
ncbi:hypothetical protein ADEAN_000697100 [Angomonas deanei]|uniref:Uncharacterized protein n=1 Tax=Angomonas deanei TaxID=59799 RepID=A0A7G2CI84_9TRYP|nr:hypothetical protein ADEAN_000697100 [Angomonas deanei]